MKLQTKTGALSALFILIALFQVPPALAVGDTDDLMRHHINTLIKASPDLRDTSIDVHVEDRLVILTGKVRLYEKKLAVERISWTISGVLEVDNEIRVVPKLPIADAAIERKILEIVKVDERFRKAGITVTVNKGEVRIKGKFYGFREPTILKHLVAKVEGVIDIKMLASFYAKSDGTDMMKG